ncbi:MAG: hypothetical protein ACYTXY_54960, partial [Nostoc sp.]
MESSIDDRSPTNRRGGCLDTDERDGTPGNRRYPPASDRTQARSQDGRVGPVRPEARLPAGQRQGLDLLSRVL